MLKRKLSTAIITAVFMASPMIVPTFVRASPQEGQQDKMKDDKMQGDKMERKRRKKHKKDDKMQSNKNQ